MISKQWRQRLLYTIMSMFVAWHTIAILLAPFQVQERSGTPPSFRFLVQAYITLFRLENTWAFFAPVGRSHQFRYIIEDSTGNTHTFVPMKEFRWYHPRYAWFERTYWGLMTSRGLYSDYFAASFCRLHASLIPVAVTLQEILEEDFRPEDHLRGLHPLDPNFVTVDTIRSIPCPQPQAPPPSKGSGETRPPIPRS
jgi:hypothetical protein